MAAMSPPMTSFAAPSLPSKSRSVVASELTTSLEMARATVARIVDSTSRSAGVSASTAGATALAIC
jgi:hypothetical protein